MLPVFLVLAARSQEPQAAPKLPATFEQAWETVRRTGYEVSDLGIGGFTARVVHDGVATEGSLTFYAGDPAVGRPSGFSHFGVSLELAVTKEVDPVEAEAWVKAALPGTKTGFVPHLGRTVTVWRYYALGDGATPEGLRKDLDATWVDALRFAEHYGAPFAAAPPVDPKRLHFAPETVLRRADYHSLLRVFGSWGWGAKERADVALPGGTFPIRVNGRLLWVRLPVPTGTSPDTRFAVERVSAKGTTPNTGAIDVRDPAKLANGTFYGRVYHPREAALNVELGDGLSLADLRRRVEAFARQG